MKAPSVEGLSALLSRGCNWFGGASVSVLRKLEHSLGKRDENAVRVTTADSLAGVSTDPEPAGGLRELVGDTSADAVGVVLLEVEDGASHIDVLQFRRPDAVEQVAQPHPNVLVPPNHAGEHGANHLLSDDRNRAVDGHDLDAEALPLLEVKALHQICIRCFSAHVHSNP